MEQRVEIDRRIVSNSGAASEGGNGWPRRIPAQLVAGAVIGCYLCSLVPVSLDEARGLERGSLGSLAVWRRGWAENLPVGDEVDSMDWPGEIADMRRGRRRGGGQVGRAGRGAEAVNVVGNESQDTGR